VWAGVVDRHPALAPYAGSLSAARNLEYTRLSAAVAEADEIAFMPPVSGG
jgi:molybdopterin converting factor small subunit